MFGQQDPTALVQAMDRYGVSVVMLSVVTMILVSGTVWTLRRFLNETNGILTLYFRGTTKQQESLANSIASQAETGQKVAAILLTTTERLVELQSRSERLERLHIDPHSVFATEHLSECFRGGLVVVGHIAEELKIEDKTSPHIERMIRELDTHMAAVTARRG